MTVKTPESQSSLEVAQRSADGNIDATIDQNDQMRARLEQPANPDASKLAQEHANLFEEKVNGAAVQKSAVHKGANGSSIMEKRGATAKALAQDTLEAARKDAADMAEAEQIMGEVAEIREEAQEDAQDTQEIDTAGIPGGEPESGEVASLSATYNGAEAEAGAALTSIEADTATAMNEALSGVQEEGPNALVQAG